MAWGLTRVGTALLLGSDWKPSQVSNTGGWWVVTPGIRAAALLWP